MSQLSHEYPDDYEDMIERYEDMITPRPGAPARMTNSDVLGRSLQGQPVNGNLKTGDTFYFNGGLHTVRDSWPAGVVTRTGQQFFYKTINGLAVFAMPQEVRA